MIHTEVYQMLCEEKEMYNTLFIGYFMRAHIAWVHNGPM